MSSRHPRFFIFTSALVALALTLVPLPHWVAVLRPAFLVLVVLYWSTMMPRAGGLLLGFGSGLSLDVFEGSLLGAHALALSLVTYLAIRLHLLVRAKPLFEQSLFVFAALMVYESMLWVIDGWSGYPLSTPTRWLHTVTGGLIWPLVVGVLGRFHTSQ
jgi:rod shape-determining protein MreD